MGDTGAAAATPKADPDDTKKNQKDKWKNFFSLSNPDLWIALGVVALVIILVRARRRPRERARAEPAGRVRAGVRSCARTRMC